MNYLDRNIILSSLILNNNMLRGKQAEKIIRAINKVQSLQHLSLAHNFLGQKHNSNQPPVCLLTSLLIGSNYIQHLDVSYNQVDAQSLYCLCFALSMSQSISYVSVEANPIGLVGIRLLMNANNTNPHTEFKINSKNCGSEIDAATDG